MTTWHTHNRRRARREVWRWRNWRQFQAAINLIGGGVRVFRLVADELAEIGAEA